MAIQELLDSFRRDLPSCDTVALGDLSSNLVLCVSSRKKPPQEQLDRLIRNARSLLDGDAGSAAADTLSDRNGARPDFALLDTVGGMRIFLRSPTEPADVLCCICAPESEAATLIDAGRAVLRAIAGDAVEGAGP